MDRNLALVLCVIILCVAVVFVVAPSGKRNTTVEVKQDKPIWEIAVRPLEHDGHRFIIVVTTPGGVALTHHPNCPCGRSF